MVLLPFVLPTQVGFCFGSLPHICLKSGFWSPSRVGITKNGQMSVRFLLQSELELLLIAEGGRKLRQYAPDEEESQTEIERTPRTHSKPSNPRSKSSRQLPASKHSKGVKESRSKRSHDEGGYDTGIPEDSDEYGSYGQDSTSANPSDGDGLVSRMSAVGISENNEYISGPGPADLSAASYLGSSEITPQASYSNSPTITYAGLYTSAESNYGAKGKSTATPGIDDQGYDPRYVAGTPGSSEKLDKSYKVRKTDYKEFFRVGRVFSTLWTESYGGTSNTETNNDTFVSVVKHGEQVYSKVRRFVIAREGNRSCTCLPVTSYSGAGYRKKGIERAEHGYIYSHRRPRQESGLIADALKVNLSKGAANLTDPSLVNYGRVYTVETNVKVKDVGMLDSESRKSLRYYYNKIMTSEGDEEGAGPPGPQAEILAGTGAGVYPSDSGGAYSGYTLGGTSSTAYHNQGGYSAAPYETPYTGSNVTNTYSTEQYSHAISPSYSSSSHEPVYFTSGGHTAAPTYQAYGTGYTVQPSYSTYNAANMTGSNAGYTSGNVVDTNYQQQPYSPKEGEEDIDLDAVAEKARQSRGSRSSGSRRHRKGK